MVNWHNYKYEKPAQSERYILYYAGNCVIGTCEYSHKYDSFNSSDSLSKEQNAEYRFKDVTHWAYINTPYEATFNEDTWDCIDDWEEVTE